ncbi:hypothetical protein DK847_00340 [Aestuariivirga litoralis]|uniref:Uncharacterized protein n=1 Tax=Aestuariivirga litoralis TaxID=2650924 RepID=A0A2W2AX37_9HYPH|nr:hypothetical protein [Aestuariivirga litoralis]PZF78312.1 hypothetical protein DK847_00340 [Aestuariivirga litoralis]
MTFLAPTLHPTLPAPGTLRRANPAMWNTGIVFLALCLVCMGLTLVDHRLFNGINVWIKPAKFFGAIGLHLLTVTAALLLLPEKTRTSGRMTALASLMVAFMIYETGYISLRAARLEASHYNETPWGALGYAMMGVGAVSVVIFTAWVGMLVLRQGPGTLLGRAVGWSFILSAPLTIVTAATLSAMGSHWIGGDQTDATGLPFFHWSTTGGDLRPAHFFALHLIQIVPAAALTGNRRFTLAVGAFTVAAALGSFGLGLAGIPLLPLR